MAAPTEEPVYTIESLIAEIREKIKARGTLGIRGLARMFKILDKNGNQQIDGEEFLWGLKDFGLDISQAEAKKVLQHSQLHRVPASYPRLCHQRREEGMGKTGLPEARRERRWDSAPR